MGFRVLAMGRLIGRVTCEDRSHAHDFVIPRVRDAGPASDVAPHTSASLKYSVNICCWPALHQAQ